MMSIIIDANCSTDALRSDPTADFAPIVQALRDGTAKVTFGGTTLLNEYKKIGTAWRFLVALDRAGRSQKVNDALVDAEEKLVAKEFALYSNDPHILALARISGARLLCSRDQALHQDFGNRAIINRPRGFVYQDAKHKHLIRKCCNSPRAEGGTL